MNRLTNRLDDGMSYIVSETGTEGVGHFTTQRRMPEIIARLAEYEDTGLMPEVCRNYKIFEDEAISKNVPFSRIVELMNAEAEGRLIVLPVNSGDTVYQLRGKQHIKGVGVSPRHISCVTVWKDDWAAYHQGATPCFKNEFGKSWFLTHEEAERALKGENNGL